VNARLPTARTILVAIAVVLTLAHCLRFRDFTVDDAAILDIEKQLQGPMPQVDSAQAAVPGMTLLGIDERGAAVWMKGEWRACGPGSVTVIKGSKIARFTSGSRVLGLRVPVRMLPTR